MGIGAALAPFLGGAAGLGTASFLPAAASMAPKVMGLFGGGQQTGGGGAAPAAMQNPFAGIVEPQQPVPPPPAKNPAFHNVFDSAAQPPSSPASVSKRPALDSDMFGPGSTHAKSPMPDDAIMVADERKMTPEAFADVEDAAGVGLNTTSSTPYTTIAKSTPVPDKTEAIEPFQTSTQPTPTPVQTAQKQSGTEGGMFGDAFSSIKQFTGDLQEKLKASQTNPLFQTGMGLLAAGYDDSINPYAAINTNLAGIQPAMIAQQNAEAEQRKSQAAIAEAEREKKAREAAMALIGMKYKPRDKDEGSEPKSQQTRGRATVIRR